MAALRRVDRAWARIALAADLIETVIAPTWQQIGRLGAIAVIRIALGYFLGKDIAQYREEPSKTA
jgi:uncharacterized membrane protein